MADLMRVLTVFTKSLKRCWHAGKYSEIKLQRTSGWGEGAGRRWRHCLLAAKKKPEV